MPPVSQAQRRWAYWALKHSKSKKVKAAAKKFIGHGVENLPERVEDGEPITKSEAPGVPKATFRKLNVDWGVDAPEGNRLSIEVMHPDGKQGAHIHLYRHEEMPKGHYTLADVEPVDNTNTIDGAPHHRNFANRLGPSVMRQTARYLRTVHGVTHVTGYRITGARNPGHGEKGGENGQTVSAELRKSFKLTLSGAMVGSRDKVPHDWHHEGTQDHPFDHRQRLVHQDGKWGAYEASKLPENNSYYVTSVQALTRGGGRLAMEHLIKHADTHGVALTVYPKPLAPSGEGVKMRPEKLKAWYRGLGFRPKQDGHMVRMPSTESA